MSSAARARLVVSVHDVSPATARASEQWVDDLDRRGILGSLLVIPGPWRGRRLEDEADFAAWLRDRAREGHEIALHGWDHTAPIGAPRIRALSGRLVARGCAEFWSLSENEAAARACRGRDVLLAAGLRPVGFAPPGWLASRAALRGLRRAGMRYVTTHRAVTDLRTGARVRAPALCHRPGAVGENAGAALMAQVPLRLVLAGRTVRIALHPDDLSRPGLREAALSGIDCALAAGAHPVTYEGLLGLEDEVWSAVGGGG